MSIKKDKAIKSNNDLFPSKISLELMQKIWNEGGKTYTDEQLLKMREFAYTLVEAIFKATKKAKQNSYLHLNHNNNETKESNIICESEYRRAS